MTLVVTALADNFLPMMFGDCLISTAGYDEALNQTEMPTKFSQDDFSHPASYLGKISGLTRKIYVMRPDLVIGWSGMCIAAEGFFKELQKRLEEPLTEEIPTLIEKAYEGRENSLSLSYIYIPEPKTHIFMSLGKFHREKLPRIGECDVIGSGAHDFCSRMRQSSDSSEHLYLKGENLCLRNFDLAVNRAITTAYATFAYELFEPKESLLHLYGGMIEFTIYNPISNRFEYLDDCLLSFWEIEEESNPPYTFYPDPLFFNTYRRNGALVIERFCNKAGNRHMVDKGYILQKQQFIANSLTQDVGAPIQKYSDKHRMFVALIYVRSDKQPNWFITCDYDEKDFLKRRNRGDGTHMFYTQKSPCLAQIEIYVQDFMKRRN